MAKVPMTVNGAEKLRAELNKLKTVERPKSLKQLRKRESMAIYARMLSIMLPENNKVSAREELPKSNQNWQNRK